LRCGQAAALAAELAAAAEAHAVTRTELRQSEAARAVEWRASREAGAALAAAQWEADTALLAAEAERDARAATERTWAARHAVHGHALGAARDRALAQRDAARAAIALGARQPRRRGRGGGA
jgi:hypothetical protein